MENGERMSLEALSKILDLMGGVGKGVVTVGAKVAKALLNSRNNIVAGKNNVVKLRNAGEPLDVVKISKEDVDTYINSAKELGLPVSMVGRGEECLMFYKHSDSKLVQMMTEDIMNDKLKSKNQEPSEIDTTVDDIAKQNVVETETETETVTVTKTTMMIEGKDQLLLTDDKAIIVGGEKRLLLTDESNSVNILAKDLSLVVYDQKQLVVGKENYLSLMKDKDGLMLVKIDKSNIPKYERLSKEFNIPITVVKMGKEYVMAFKETDLKKFELVASNLEKTEQEKSSKTSDTKDHKDKDKNTLPKDHSKELDSEKDNDKSDEKLGIEDKKVNPDNNIRNQVEKAKEQLSTPRVDKEIEVIKETTVAKVVER